MSKKTSSEASFVLSAQEEDFLLVIRSHTHGIYGLDLLNIVNDVYKRHGRKEIGVGSLYPALKRMVRKGFIEPRWGCEEKEAEASQGARRRYYEITGLGIKALDITSSYRQQLRNGDPLPGF